MGLKEISYLKNVVNHWFFCIICITVFAIFLRVLPSLLNAAWGCDFGIYYGLTNSFVSSGELYAESTIWGGAYQFFPVLYAITGSVHWLTGIDIITLMPKFVPIFGGLSIFLFYFVVFELLKDRKKALLSSLFLAVLPFHVYQTSQAAPLTLGHFFYMLSFLLFIKSRTSKRYIFPLFVSSALLILTHHLTMYFYIITILSVVFIENSRNTTWIKSFRMDILYIFIVSGCTFAYWSIVATPVYTGFMNYKLLIGSFTLSSNEIIIIFYGLLLAMIASIPLIRRVKPVQIPQKSLSSSPPLLFIVILFSILGIIAIISSLNLPWAIIYLTPKSVLYSLPLLIIISLGFVGLYHIKQIPNWQILGGWLFPLFFSFTYGIITLNRTILPHRHLEYIMAPLSIFAIFGIYSLGKYDYSSIIILKSHIIKRRKILYPFAVVLLVATNAASVYPSYLAWEALEESYETITDDNLVVIQWIDQNLDHNTSVIAADHRLSLLANAVGFNTTRDQAIYLWNTSNVVLYIDELFGVQFNYSKVTHVMVDSIMRNHVVHIGFDGKKSFMTNESYEKFFEKPFELLYRNATYNDALEEIHWTEIYQINWTFIEKNIWPFASLYFVYSEFSN
jgi:hypothetical protein